MALSAVKTFSSGEVLTASDLNAMNTNILNNALSLISPLTGTLDTNGNPIIFDADADTSITADTDDQLDFNIGGTDRFYFSNTRWAATTLDRDTSVNEVVSSVTETTVYTFSVPANTLGTNKALRITVLGDYLNNSGGVSNLAIKLKYGATTALSYSEPSIAASATRRPVKFEAILAALGATGAQVAYGEIRRGSTAGVTGNVNFDDSTSFTSGINTGVAEDSTGALTLSVTVQHDINAATVSFKTQVVFLELI